MGKAKMFGFAVALATLAAGVGSAQARGGNGFGPGDSLIAESIEKSARLARLQGVDLTAAQAAAREISATQAEVVFTLSTGATASFDCQVVDELSRGGTVLKKDVRCARR